MENTGQCRLHRVNSLPPVLLGLSSDELVLVILLVMLSTLVLTCGIGFLLGVWWIGIVITPLLSVIGVRYVAAFLRAVKLGKPDNYYPVYVMNKIERILGNDVWSYSGPWFVVRRNRYNAEE